MTKLVQCKRTEENETPEIETEVEYMDHNIQNIQNTQVPPRVERVPFITRGAPVGSIALGRMRSIVWVLGCVDRTFGWLM